MKQNFCFRCQCKYSTHAMFCHLDWWLWEKIYIWWEEPTCKSIVFGAITSGEESWSTKWYRYNSTKKNDTFFPSSPLPKISSNKVILMLAEEDWLLVSLKCVDISSMNSLRWPFFVVVTEKWYVDTLVKRWRWDEALIFLQSSDNNWL